MSVVLRFNQVGRSPVGSSSDRGKKGKHQERGLFSTEKKTFFFFHATRSALSRNLPSKPLAGRSHCTSFVNETEQVTDWRSLSPHPESHPRNASRGKDKVKNRQLPDASCSLFAGIHMSSRSMYNLRMRLERPGSTSDSNWKRHSQGSVSLERCLLQLSLRTYNLDKFEKAYMIFGFDCFQDPSSLRPVCDGRRVDETVIDVQDRQRVFQRDLTSDEVPPFLERE